MAANDNNFTSDLEKIKADLRKKAEAALRHKAAHLPELSEEMPLEEIRKTLHELHVHQIELEMQNEELRRAQAELDAARIRYFELYDLAPVGYISLSEKGLIVEANLTVANLLGLDRAALVRQPVSRYIHQEDQDIYYLHRKDLFETGEPQVCELRMRNKAGSLLWVQLDANVDQDEEGTPLCRLVLSDITARKQVEEEKTKIEAQYHQAQKMESISRLAGGVAHDFNNKLSIILGFLEIVMDETDPSDSKYADMKEIHEAALHSATLTRQLLTFARKEMVMPTILDLNDIVEEILNMLRRLIGENINLFWLPESGLWSVKMDPSQLDQILTNLCINSRDAIAGDGKITISSENIIADKTNRAAFPECIPGEYVVLTISDNGCGMDKDTLEEIFEPFFTTKDVDEGAGLGLATVYGAVKQNNGFIYAESEPGLGTTFRIFLPRYKDQSIDMPEEKSVEQTQLGIETILLVEDELTLLKMATKMLQRLGYNVLAASTPSQAISLARESGERINLMLTDIMMPEMNGRELANSIFSFSPKLKTLFMSGYSFDIISKQGKIASDIHFIQKPFTKHELATKVRLVLES